MPRHIGRRLLRLLLGVVVGRDEWWRLTSLCKSLPEPVRKEVFAELSRRNLRSRGNWLGGIALLLPIPALHLAARLVADHKLAYPLGLIVVGAVGFAAVLPGSALLRMTYARNLGAILRERNVCITCGYDLRATPDRCPECGAAPAAPSA